jgi:hypothetical protein
MCETSKAGWVALGFPEGWKKNLIDWNFCLKKSLGHRKIKVLDPHDGTL